MRRQRALLPEEVMPDPVQRIEQTMATAALVEAGYEQIGPDPFAKPSDPMVVRQREGRLRRNVQGDTTDEATALLGFGTSAIGSLPQGYVQNASSTFAYRGAGTNTRLATARDLAPDGTNMDFTAELAAVDEPARDGLAMREGLSVAIPEDSRLPVRTVCAALDHYLESGGVRGTRAPSRAFGGPQAGAQTHV